MNNVCCRMRSAFALAAGLAVLATGALGQGGSPGGPPAGEQADLGMYWIPVMPELGKKMNQIMVLRDMLAMRLTAKNIAAALPSLKKLRDAEKALRIASDKLLDQEKQALLSADPDGPPVASNGTKLHNETLKYHKAEEECWKTIADVVGHQRADGLRRFVTGGFGPGGGFGGGGTAPGADPEKGLGPPSRLGGATGSAPGRSAPGGSGSANEPNGNAAQKAPPGPYPTFGQMKGPMWQYFAMWPRLSLTELIELLEQKLAAMKG